MVFGRQVQLHIHGLDRYGRTLAVVFVDGIDANVEQVRSGFAWCFTRYLEAAPADIQTSYRQAQEEAKAKRIGLWVDPNPVEPW